MWRPSVTPGQTSGREQTRLIAFSDIGNLFDSRGRLKPLNRLPPEIACTVLSVTQRRRRNGDEIITIRMRDKIAALKKLLDRTLARKAGLSPSLE